MTDGGLRMSTAFGSSDVEMNKRLALAVKELKSVSFNYDAALIEARVAIDGGHIRNFPTADDLYDLPDRFPTIYGLDPDETEVLAQSLREREQIIVYFDPTVGGEVLITDDVERVGKVHRGRIYLNRLSIRDGLELDSKSGGADGISATVSSILFLHGVGGLEHKSLDDAKREFTRVRNRLYGGTSDSIKEQFGDNPDLLSMLDGVNKISRHCKYLDSTFTREINEVYFPCAPPRHKNMPRLP